MRAAIVAMTMSSQTLGLLETTVPRNATANTFLPPCPGVTCRHKVHALLNGGKPFLLGSRWPGA